MEADKTRPVPSIPSYFELFIHARRMEKLGPTRNTRNSSGRLSKIIDTISHQLLLL